MSQGLWVTPDDLGDELAADDYAVDACEAASFILWGMSGRKFSGIWNISERYVINEPRNINWVEYSASLNPNTLTTSPQLLPYLSNYDGKRTIVLRGRPVIKINSIRYISDGTIVSPDNYYLRDHATIVFSTDLSEELEINYTYGALPPAAGRMAARELAYQFALHYAGRDDECTLPARVTSVDRQGVSWTLLDNQDFIADLRTGIYAVDLFLKTVNPNAAQQRSKVFSVDVPRGKRTTPKPFRYNTGENDLKVGQTGSGEVILDLAEIGGTVLQVSGNVPQVVVHNWSGTRSTTLPSGNLVVGGGSIAIHASYSDVYSTLGLSDPGTWDLYAVNGPTSTYITSGNVNIKLS